MKIVVLDGYTLNPGDLSWEGLAKLGTCTIYDRTAPDDVVSRAQDAEIVLTNKTPLTREQILSLPALRYIGVLATGYNIVDVQTARQRGVPVSNVPSYGTRSVAQTTFALLLELTQHTGHHAATVRNGTWSRSPDFCYWDYPLIELDGLTFGIVGYGRIGRAVAQLASAFGMQVLAASRTNPADGSGPARLTSLNEVFAASDIVSLHCPLTDDTRHLVNAQRLAGMKPTAFLLNTSRGPLIDEPALADALNNDRLAGAGLDVLAMEPPNPDNPLLHAKNCVITPHIAWATRAARERLMQTAVSNVKAYLDGKPQNVVN